MEARLALEHLEQLSRITGMPLVLHGGSGIRREDVRESMKKGIAKINVGTEIRQAFEQALKATGSVAAAQDALFVCTVSLIKDWFGISGIRSRLFT